MRDGALLSLLLLTLLAVPTRAPGARIRSDALVSMGSAAAASGLRLGASAALPIVGKSIVPGAIEIAGFWRPAASGIASAPEGESIEVGLPLSTGLDRIWPNPTRGPLSIRYRIAAATATASSAWFEIFDLLGRRVVNPVASPMQAGFHSADWEGTDDQGRPLAAGRYFLRFTAGDQRETRAITILR